jgi:hypothetical protein
MTLRVLDQFGYDERSTQLSEPHIPPNRQITPAQQSNRDSRRNHIPAFKAKMALAALKGIGHWRSFPSSSTSILIRLLHGRRSLRAKLLMVRWSPGMPRFPAQNQDDLSTTLRNARPAAKARQLSTMI